jgi:hypothetical protein
MGKKFFTFLGYEYRCIDNGLSILDRPITYESRKSGTDRWSLISAEEYFHIEARYIESGKPKSTGK